MNYKDTLNIPNTEFEMKANLNKKEPIIQQKWLENKIYEKVLLKNKNNNSFLLHDGPPYANGDLHVGHALNKTLKDIIIRYKSFKGFYAPFIPGWDTHGLPIELAMLKKDANAKFDSILVKREKCKQYALDQVKNQCEQFKKMGLLSDLEKKYLTLDHEFEIKQLKSFLTMVEKDLIFQDLKPVYWSWSSNTSLADAEIEYSDVSSDSIYFCFDLDDINFKDTKIIVWTTTPWTLPSNLAVAVNPDFTYTLFESNKQKYIVCKDLFNKIIDKLKLKNIRIIKKIKGHELEKINYFHPFKQIKCPIILADYVSNTDGTGLVHNAPGFGLDDYIACKKYNIDIYCPIDNYGKFDSSVQDKELENLFYLDANEIIINRLKEKNNLLLSEKIIHSAACDWRTKKPLMYRATKQWFVNLQKCKDNIIKTLENNVFSVNKKNVNRMIEMIQKRDEWCISRQRVWGVPLPIIYKNDEPLLDVDLIKNIIDILDKKGVNAWFELDVQEFLTPKYKTNDVYKKEVDIMDVWFDSGCSNNMFESWKLNYPADLYLEGSDQYRGWFNSSLIIGTITHNNSPYKALLQHGFVLDEKGFKMSKSKGNTVSPQDVFNKYGVDIFRLWTANSEYQIDLRIGDSILSQQTEIYRKIRNTLFKYLLSVLNDFDFEKNKTEIKSLENRYILYRLNKLISSVEQNYEKFNFIDVVKEIYNFVIELSTWYFELIKDTLYCLKLNDPIRREVQTTLYMLLKKITILLAPILVHTTEEVYSFLKAKNKKESIHLEDWVDSCNVDINENEIKEMESFFKLKDKVLLELEKIRNNKEIKKNNEAIVILSDKYKDLFKIIDLKKYLLVADLEFDSNLEIEQIKVKNANYHKCERCWSFKKTNEIKGDVCLTCFDVLNN